MTSKKQTHKTFRFTSSLFGKELVGSVTFSPAPQPGIFTALAEFEAKRLLNQILLDEIDAGRI